MGIQVNRKVLKRVGIFAGSLGLICGTTFGVRSCTQHERQAEAAAQADVTNPESDAGKAAQEASNQAYADADMYLTQRADAGTEYTMLGPNTISVVEADVVYRFNYAMKVMVVRHSVDPKEGVATVLTFNQFANPEYTDQVRDIACNIASDAPKIYQDTDKTKMKKDATDALQATLASLKMFHTAHCAKAGPT